MNNWPLILVAIVFLILIPFTPQLVRLRIRIMRWLNWNWAVNMLETYFQVWVWVFRIILFVIAAALFYVGWND